MKIKDKLILLLLSPVLLLLAIGLLPFLGLIWVYSLFKGFWLNCHFRLRHKNKHILFVHSNSPNWQEYIENVISPRIEGEAVFLNWSKRSEWKNKKPLEAKALEHWGGCNDFNPMAIIFSPKMKVETIRFHSAFKDYKHGKDLALNKNKALLYGHLKNNV